MKTLKKIFRFLVYRNWAYVRRPNEGDRLGKRLFSVLNFIAVIIWLLFPAWFILSSETCTGINILGYLLVLVYACFFILSMYYHIHRKEHWIVVGGLIFNLIMAYMVYLLWPHLVNFCLRGQPC